MARDGRKGERGEAGFSNYRVQGSGTSGFRVQEAGFRNCGVQGSGGRVQELLYDRDLYPEVVPEP
ncbi:MAG TPA: hypothetical protein VIQ60_05725 [Gemmatimonadaceae bacterium]